MKKKSNPADKNSVIIQIEFGKELAQGIENFKTAFKPETHIVDGKTVEFTENDFWKQLILLGAETLQQELRFMAEELKKKTEEEVKNNPLPETVDQNESKNDNSNN